VGREAMLVLVLRAVGLCEAAAFAAVLMPRAWMEAIHASMGIGDFPDGPITEYLARSVSFVYGVHGVLLWLLARDPARYRPLIAFTGTAYVLSGIAFLAISLVTRMPLYWTVAEPGACLLVGGMILLLSRSNDRAAS
jgi:hypothetical protein